VPILRRGFGGAHSWIYTTRGQDFGFQPSSRLEAVAQHADKEECDCDLRSQSCSDSVAAVTPADAVFGSDRRAAIIGDSLKIGVCFLVS
jgi:hypothetical protein